MTVHKKRQAVPVGREEAAQEPFAGKELRPELSPSISGMRKKHDAGTLTREDSLSLILAGNLEHVESLRAFNVSPAKRHERIKNGPLDYLVIACSDSRVHRMDAESSPLVGVQVRIAGNVVPKPGTPSFEEMNAAVGKVVPDGPVLIEGHIHCGAVNTRKKWVEDGQKPTGSESLDALLHEVVGTSPRDNALAQLEKARQTLPIGSRPSGALYYDWETGTVEMVNTASSAVMGSLATQWKHNHVVAFKDKGTQGHIGKQAPHTIAVAADDLPFSVGTITHARPNEIFCTTGSANGLDDMDKASILYAFEHLHVRHISFIAPGTEKDNVRLMGMFTVWERNLRDIRAGGKRILANALNSGELEITCLRYDLGNGMLVRIA